MTYDEFVERFCKLDDKVERYEGLLRSSMSARCDWQYREASNKALNRDREIMMDVRSALSTANHYACSWVPNLKAAEEALIRAEADYKKLHHA